MQLQKQPVEAWQHDKHHLEENNAVRTQSQEEKFSQYLSMAFNWSLKAVNHVK